jgi:hypothetical protein
VAEVDHLKVMFFILFLFFVGKNGEKNKRTPGQHFVVVIRENLHEVSSPSLSTF